ncbi:hypothetical protein LMG22037_06611 [Paraburkholderia phenoliruptrix]|uniref:Phage tail collar domain-containing protein n=1 Tax=Paraburkholderia phenoliruptrix TaxID=252970 RepID=A0A6J5CNX1_9BURK|nr:hypothetical protein [Paraburkholderia phenoliruptrix]CAB3742574.1 hypothetical protein LMG22037_06611 [Paraburkholderia phenoliruptrix]
MTTFIFANNINTTLAGNVSTSATTITLSSSANLPSSIPSGSALVITLNDRATRQNYEVVYATAITGTTLTVVRAQEGTSALAWLTGDFVFDGPTAGQQASFAQTGGNNTWTGTNSFNGGISVTGTAAVTGNVSATAGFSVPNTVPYQLTSTAGPFSALYCSSGNQVVVGASTLPLILLGSSGGNVFGIGQTQQTVIRNYNTNYQNNTNAPIMVSCATSSTGAGSMGIYVGGVEVSNSTATGSGVALCAWAIVPPGVTYQYATTGSVSGTATFTEWR